MLKIAVCDDNKVMLNYLGEIISENIVCHFKEFEVQKFLSGNDFLSEHNKSPFDIVFLDIKMPDMNGFEVAKRIRLLSEKTYIVFITTESGLVYDAFDYRPFWFIPKENSDILKSKIASVILKLKNHISDNRPIRIPLSYNDCKYVMPDNIIYISSKSNYLIFVCKNDEIRTRGKIETALEMLPPKIFVRIHNRFIINMKHLCRIDNTNFKVLLDDKTELDISRAYKSQLVERYDYFLRDFS